MADPLWNGAPLPETTKLAQHSDIKLTMRYTHIGMDIRGKAVANLSAPKGRPGTAADVRS